MFAHFNREPECNILDVRLIEDFERNRVKIKYEPEPESTSIAGRTLRKTPARACAKSIYSLENQTNSIKVEPINEVTNQPTNNKPSNALTDELTDNESTNDSTSRLNKNFKVLIEDCTSLDEFHNNFEDEDDSPMNEEMDCEEYDESNEESDNQEEKSSLDDEENYSSYSPSSQESNECTVVDRHYFSLSNSDRAADSMSKVANNNTKTQLVISPMNRTSTGSVHTIVKHSKASLNHKPANASDAISSLKSTVHVRNNLTNLNHLNPSTLKVTKSQPIKNSFMRNQTEMDTSSPNSSSTSSLNLSLNSLNGSATNSTSNSRTSSKSSLRESPSDDCFVDKLNWTPEFFKNRIEFANQVVITQIKDKNTIITFKESRKGFPKTC